MSERNHVLQMENITMQFGGVVAVNNLSLEVNEGEIVALIGPNGAGKSTLFRCLLGLHRSYRGSITIAGREGKSLSPREMAALVAYIPQTHTPTFHYTVLEMVLMGTTHQVRGLQSPGEREIAIAREALAQVGIAGMERRSYGQLSGGEQQRVAIARALVSGPALVLADEPTGNLDSENTRLMGDLFRDLHRAQGCAFVLVTHAPDVAMWADRVVVLKDGSIVDDRSTAEFAGPAELSSFYERTLNDVL